MELLKKQSLRSPDIRPSGIVIAEALGEANSTYIRFIDKLANHHIQLEWRYYNDGKAWLAKGLHKSIGVRGGIKETTVFWLSVWEGFFKVTIYVAEKDREDILGLSLTDGVKQMILESRQMGKLKFFPVVFELTTDDFLESIFILSDYKSNKK